MRALTDQIELAHSVQVEVDVDAAEQLAEQDAGRDVPDHPRGDRPGSATRAAADPVGDDAADGRRRLETAIADDAPGERRRRSLDELAERARTLNGVLTVDQGEDAGTTVRVVLPPYATSR